MAPRDAAVGSKRKLTDRTKDKSSKKPKVEKRSKPQPQEASDGISDTSAFEDFSDDPEDGGAPLSNGKSQKSDKQYNGSKVDDAQAGKVFERGMPPYSPRSSSYSSLRSTHTFQAKIRENPISSRSS